MFRRIVVPLDGSDLAEQALPYAEHLARVLGAPMCLVRVVDVASVAGFGIADYGYASDTINDAYEREVEIADEYLTEMAKEYAGGDIIVHTERRNGRVTHELLAVARHGDVFVMASHGRGGVSRWFLGSVAEEVTRHSPVPVMIVRAPDATRRRAERFWFRETA